jgi:hypothetical protein
VRGARASHTDKGNGGELSNASAVGETKKKGGRKKKTVEKGAKKLLTRQQIVRQRKWDPAAKYCPANKKSKLK